MKHFLGQNPAQVKVALRLLDVQQEFQIPENFLLVVLCFRIEGNQLLFNNLTEKVIQPRQHAIQLIPHISYL